MIRKVKGCDGCPAAHEDINWSNPSSYWCELYDGDDNSIEGIIPGRTPSWCPLRKEPITIELEEG